MDGWTILMIFFIASGFPPLMGFGAFMLLVFFICRN